MNVPPELREPFDSAIKRLNDVAETFQEAARTGDESGTNQAKAPDLPDVCDTICKE